MDDLGDWIGKIIVWIIFGFIALCIIYPLVEDYQEKQKSKNQKEIQSEAPRWTEEDNRNFQEGIKQVTKKSEEKIRKLGYSMVDGVNVDQCTNEYGTTSTPVKIGGDKVYTLTIYFKKFQEYEIIRIDLWDEGSMTKRQIE